MRIASLKILTTLLLLGVAISAALYHFRLDLLKITANQLLLASDMQIEEILDLQVSGNHLTIKSLTVVVGDKKLTLSFDDIALHYSLINWQLSTVTAKRATLMLKEEQETSFQQKAPEAVSIIDMLSTLKKIPLQRLSIGVIESGGMAPPVALVWQREENSQTFHVEEQGGSRLSIDLDYLEATRWRGKLVFQSKGLKAPESQAMEQKVLQPQAMELRFLLEPDKDNHHLSITTELNIETLAAIINRYYPLPAVASSVSGNIPIQIESNLPDKYIGGSPVSQATIELGAAHVFLADKETPLALHLIKPLVLQLTLEEKSTSLTLISTEKIPFSIQSPDNSQQAVVEFSKLQCRWQSDPACSLDYQASLDFTELHFDQYHLAGLNAELQGNMQLSPAQLDVTAIPGHLVSSATADSGDIKAIKPALITQSNLKFQYNFANNALAIAIDQFDILLPKIKTADFNIATRINISGLSASIGESLSTQFQLLSDSINLQLPKQWLPALAIQMDVKLQDNTLSANGHLLGDRKKLLVNFNGKHHLGNNHGSAKVATEEFVFDTDSNKLSSWFSSWPFQADLQGGKALITAELAWSIAQDQWALTGTSTQTLTDVSGYAGNLALVDLDFEHSLDILSPDNWASSDPGTITIATFDVGVPITDLSLRISVDTKRQEINFYDVTSHLFGGTVSSRDFIYNATKETNPLMVNLDNIHIEEIMKLAVYDDIQANGIIDGQLPMSIGQQGISIDAGELSAQSPGGVIRYQPESGIAVANNNGSMKLVTEALQHYQYDTMLAGVRYSKEGDLALKIKMQGKNPDLNNGQRINLNLNIEDNIPMLLKSLRSGRVIAEFLSNKISN